MTQIKAMGTCNIWKTGNRRHNWNH